jgi:hypothetical protein
MSKRSKSSKGFNRCDVTYIIAVLALGLASQRGERFEMSQPQLLVQTQV